MQLTSLFFSLLVFLSLSSQNPHLILVMAIVAASADQATELLQKLSLDSQTKTLEIPEPTKKPSGNQFGVVDGSDATNGQNQSYERSVTPLLQEFMDPSVCYVPNGYSSYYYGGYDGTTNEWEDYSRYMNPEGVEMSAGFMGIMAHSYTTMDMDMHLIAHIH